MEVAGLCSMCGRIAKPAHSCSMCGAVVCVRCFNFDLGICRRCDSQMNKG